MRIHFSIDINLLSSVHSKNKWVPFWSINETQASLPGSSALHSYLQPSLEHWQHFVMCSNWINMHQRAILMQALGDRLQPISVYDIFHKHSSHWTKSGEAEMPVSWAMSLSIHYSVIYCCYSESRKTSTSGWTIKLESIPFYYIHSAWVCPGDGHTHNKLYPLHTNTNYFIIAP